MSRFALLVVITELLALLGGGPRVDFARHASHRATADVVATHATIARLARSEQPKRRADTGSRLAAFAPSAAPVIARSGFERARLVLRADSVSSANAPVPRSRGPPLSG